MHYTVYSKAKLNAKLPYGAVAINVKQNFHASYNICDRILENLPFGHKQTFEKTQLKIFTIL